MPYHDNLISKLKEIKVKNKNHFRFISLVEKKQYTKALLTGCSECKPNDVIQLELITTLLSYKNKLSIDIDQKDHFNNTSLSYAMNLKNNKLYLRLKNAGADETILYHNDFSIAEYHDFNLYDEVNSHIQPNFQKEEQELDRLYKQLKTRADLPDEQENALFDLPRIKFILHSLDHLHKYYSDMNRGNLIPVTLKLLDAEQRRMLFNITNREARNHLERVCVTIQNLSRELRGRYDNLFKPEPFTWHTFERLGGLIKLKETSRHYNIPLPYAGDQFENDPGCGERFRIEIEASEEYCEEAIIDIIDTDVPLLRKFFDELYERELQPMGEEPSPVNSVSLVVCKAFLNRLGDNVTLSNVLNLLNYSENVLSLIPIDKIGKNGPILLLNPLLPHEAYKQRFNLSTKSGRHAALRRLQHIGEFCTGKKFSKRTTDLDETTEWGALVAVRHALCHPDERDNKHKIDSLLNDVETLERIVGTEIGQFLHKFFNLISLREKATGVFDGDTKKHWRSILQEYIQWLKKESEICQEETIERRTSLENEEKFIAGLKKDTPEEVITECRRILNGTATRLPNKKGVGFLISHLQPRVGPPDDPSRKQFKLLSTIMHEALNKKTTEEERQLVRLQREARKQQRMLEREQQFTGLDSLRQLAKNFSSPPAREHTLSPLKRVSAALEALYNIKEFLTESGYLIPGLPYNTLEEWDAFHNTQGREILALQLESNCELNDALEFNAGHLLQFLEQIRSYEEAKDSYYLTEGYDALRTLRNYIEHGDPLFDTIGYNPDKRNYPSKLRQQKILPALIDLIYHFAPELENIKMALMKEKELDSDYLDLPELVESAPIGSARDSYNPRFFGNQPIPESNVVSLPTSPGIHEKHPVGRTLI